ncbi:MAG TPA: class I SAM-dependent RNA methyltransferase [Phaeodactylibacter sp.]|nr:class I SAM-dependent RNA methyltransferase [Phaeodactylibacter sp.]
MKFLAKTVTGLEEIMADEIKQLGGTNIKILKRAASFEGDLKLLYRANLELRTAIRILMPIYSFKARNENDFYKKIRMLDWSKYMKVSDTLAIDATTYSEIFTHSKYIALKAKDAIVDQFRDQTGRRPNVNLDFPTLRVNIHIYMDEVTVSLDSSGEPLFKRGYRVERMDAPLNEVLAAGMILSSGWKKDCDFVDAMCGSGTLPIEAGLIARNIPSQWFRTDFGFQKWRDFNHSLWQTVRAEAKANQTTFDHHIYGFDRDFRALSMARVNILSAQLTDLITLKRTTFEKLEAPSPKGIMILNPPYDERLHIKNINELYAMMGDQFKQNFKGWEVWMISSNMEALKHIGLRPSKKIHLMNGALDCKFLKFEMYEGSKKKKFAKEE